MLPLLLCSWVLEACAFTPLGWSEARRKAREMVKLMSSSEKASLMHGKGWWYYFTKKWWYIGNTPAIPRLNIPSLNMQDAANGFRPIENEVIGTVTCWPSLLALGATWDEELVYAFGKALGREFAGKGANGLLGPSVNVHRVARGGRNFEYISGEDPYLGSRLVVPYVRGVHSEGVFTVVKHFSLNQQETHRTTQSSIVDEKTRWELYYPPFEAAINAGTPVTMCSYNRVDGVHSCENRKILQDHLKGTMQFQGFVQSDWWATHSTSVSQGLDQSMPGTHNYLTERDLFCKQGELLVESEPPILIATAAVLLVSLVTCGTITYKLRSHIWRSSPANTAMTARDVQGNTTPVDTQVQLAETGGAREVGIQPTEQDRMPLYARLGCCNVCVMVTCLIFSMLSLAICIFVPALSFHKCVATSSSAIDEAVERILAVMYRMDLFNSTKCSPPHCKEWLLRNVTSPEHSKLALDIAAESIVLLKNSNDVLPILSSHVKKLAVVGSASVATVLNENMLDIILRASRPVLIIAAIMFALLVLAIFIGRRIGNKWSCWGATIFAAIVLGIGTYEIAKIAVKISHQWGYGDLYAGGGSGHVVPLVYTTPLQGIQDRAASAGITVLSATTDDPDSAAQVAQEADVTIVVAGTSSGEAMDRANLHLDNGADDLIKALAPKVKKLVVLLQIPGAVLMPWHDAVDGIAVMFLGGQATGAAWAEIIFGDRPPVGRLPLMIPATDADTIPPENDLDVHYTEGLATSYRSAKFKYTFPFGHGLTYTNFSYSGLTSALCENGATCVKAHVTNVGKVAASTTAQLYLQFPHEANQPAPILKGFSKTRLLQPGNSTSLSFPLSTRDISYYESGNWIASENGTVHIGESFDDIRLSAFMRFDVHSKRSASATEHMHVAV